jgi:hypothetical protein
LDVRILGVEYELKDFSGKHEVFASRGIELVFSMDVITRLAVPAVCANVWLKQKIQSY